jgi:Phage Tail Collar Domain
MRRRLVLTLPLLLILSTPVWHSSNPTSASVVYAATASTTRNECGTVLECAQAAAQLAHDASLAADRATAAFPAGTVVAFAGKNLPAGWLWCNGDILPRAGVYSRLYAALGETYGRGDGRTTFGIPDYRGKFLRGIDQQGAGGMSKIDQDRIKSGGGVGSPQDESFKAHHHDADAQKFSEVGPSPGVEHYGGFGTGQSLGEPPGKKVSTEETGGSETRPINVAVNWIVKY